MDLIMPYNISASIIDNHTNVDNIIYSIVILCYILFVIEFAIHRTNLSAKHKKILDDLTDKVKFMEFKNEKLFEKIFRLDLNKTDDIAYLYKYIYEYEKENDTLREQLKNIQMKHYQFE